MVLTTSGSIERGEITREDIRAWVIDHIPEERMELITRVTDKTEEEVIDHVTLCLHHICRWYDDPKGYVGNFIRYLLMDKFIATVGMADSTNKRLLDVYASFLYQYMPGDYRKKAKDEFVER